MIKGGRHTLWLLSDRPWFISDAAAHYFLSHANRPRWRRWLDWLLGRRCTGCGKRW